MVGAAQDDYITYSCVSGEANGGLGLTIEDELEEGLYVLRYHDYNSTKVVAESAPFPMGGVHLGAPASSSEGSGGPSSIIAEPCGTDLIQVTWTVRTRRVTGTLQYFRRLKLDRMTNLFNF